MASPLWPQSVVLRDLCPATSSKFPTRNPRPGQNGRAKFSLLNLWGVAFMAQARAVRQTPQGGSDPPQDPAQTMQMIATAKFQKSLKRAVGTKPYTLKVRELVAELAASAGGVDHPLLRSPQGNDRTRRGRPGGHHQQSQPRRRYSSNVLRLAVIKARELEAQGEKVELYVCGKKGVSYFNFQKRPITQRLDVSDTPRFEEVKPVSDDFMDQFISGKIDAVYVAYMNFISAGQQKADVMQLLPSWRE